MKQIRKEYDRPFLLEPTKLTRLMNSIHERLSQVQIVNTRQNNGRSLVVSWPPKTNESSRQIGTTRKSVKQ